VACISGCALISGLSTLDVDDGSASVDASDDLDVRSDAADAGCCFGAIPPGFTPVLLGPSDTKCGALKSETVVLDPQTTTASGACTCGCTLGGCAGGTLRFYDGAGCAGSVGNVALGGGCAAAPPNFALTSAFRVLQPGTPSCTLGTASFPAASSGSGSLCRGDAKTACSAFCSPAPNVKSCLVVTGNVACPTGLKKQLVAQSVTDARTCTGCACNVAGGSCGADVQFYADGACTTASGGPMSLPFDACTTGIAAGPQLIAKPRPSGTCTTTPGVASGGTTPVGVATVCCK
jgi:hypothetical protein